MKNNFKTPIWFFLFLFLGISCSKSESDFIGNYKFKYCRSLNFTNVGMYSFFLGPSKKENTEAKKVNLLGNGECKIFKDASTKQLNGEFHFTNMKVDSRTSSYLETDDYTFNLKNLRLENDTLVFSVSNQMTELMGKSFKGVIYEENGVNCFGIEEEFFGKSDCDKNNPWFLNRKNGLVSFQTSIDNSEETKFYSQQTNHLNEELKRNDIEKREQRILQNSIDYIEANYLGEKLESNINK